MIARFLFIVVLSASVIGCAGLSGKNEAPTTSTVSPRFDVAQSPANLRYTLCINDCPNLTRKTVQEPVTGKGERIDLSGLEQRINLLKAMANEKNQYRKEIIWFQVNTAKPTRKDIETYKETLISYTKGARKIVISGRTDSSGALSTNKGLAEKRAALVLSWLGDAAKVNKATLEALDTRPMCCYLNDNETSENRKLNRRVEVEYFY